MIKTVNKKIKNIYNYRLGIYITIATLSMVFFTYLTPPTLSKPFFSFIKSIQVLPGDFPSYISRFLLSFFLLGMIPFIAVLICGETPESIGLKINFSPFKWYHVIFFLILAVLAGITGGLSSSLAAYYPYSRYLIHEVLTLGWGLFFVHILLYGLLYYLPWELFFRGFLILPFINELEKNRIKTKDSPKLLYGIIVFQTIPSTLLHFGHPLSELMSAIPAGIIFGWLVYKTRSISLSFILHFAVGIATDMTVIIHQGLQSVK